MKVWRKQLALMATEQGRLTNDMPIENDEKNLLMIMTPIMVAKILQATVKDHRD